MSKIIYTLFFIQFIFLSPTLIAQSEDCNVFELLPGIEPGQLSNDDPPVPCGFFAPDGSFINECSPCGKKVSSDNCFDTPMISMCELDGFVTTTNGYTPDVTPLAQGFCNGAGTIENNLWVGFVAQTNSLEIFVEAFNCTSENNQSLGIQFAIVQTDCVSSFTTMSGSNPCIFIGLFNSSSVLSVNNLVPGEEYYLMMDGFAGDVCEISLDVLSGFGISEYDILPISPGQLCPDILNPGEFTTQIGSGAQVFLNTGGIATTDLTFYWLNPQGDLIAVTAPTFINGSQVGGELDASFFTELGTYIVEIIDNGSCCPICTSVPLKIASPPPGAAAIVVGSSGQGEIDCTFDELMVEGGPSDGSVPTVEQWLIEDANGMRQSLGVSIVASNGRLNEFIITKEIIEAHFPGQNSGEANVIYGFLADFNQFCFSDASVTIPFDFVTGVGCDNEECIIENIQFEVECTGFESFFEISLNFDHENTSGVVEVVGDGEVYGQFNVSTQPIIINDLDANDRAVFEFIIRDVQFGAECSGGITVDDILCGEEENDDCMLEFIEVDSFTCNTDGTYNMTASYGFVNGNNNLIEVSINGGAVQSFINNGSTMFTNIEPRQNSDSDIIEICLNDNPDCCNIVEYAQPDCEQEPEFECIDDFEVTDIDCVGEGEYSFTLDFDLDNINVGSFSIDINGDLINEFGVSSLPVNIIVSVNDFAATDNLTISYGNLIDTCVVSIIVPRPSCLFNAIDESLLDDLEIHPNPTIDILHINYIPQEVIGLNIIDNLGRTIEHLNTSGDIQLDVSSYSSGVYFMQFFTADYRIMSRRFVKM